MTNADRQEMLPGLDVGRHGDGALVVAVGSTIEALEAKQTIDQARKALAISLARIIETKQETGRLSTVANDARVLLDLLDGLVPDAGEVDDDLKAAIEAWAETP